MRISNISIGISLVLFCLPFLAGAFTFQSGSQIDVSNRDFFEENLYLIGGKVFFDDEINKDVLIVSGESDLKGKFGEDIQAFAGRLNLSGQTLGDVRILGGEINLENETSKDLFVVAGKVNILDGAVLNGRSMIIAGEVNIEGQVNNDIKIIAAKTTVNGELNSKTEITSQKIYFGDGAKIKGYLNYFSPQKADISSGAKIEADTRFNKTEKISENSVFKKVVLNMIIFWSVIKFLASLFLVLILVFIFKVFSQRVSQIAIKKPIKSIFVGLVSLFVIPIVCIVLFASLFAIPVSIILGFVYLILLILTGPVSGIIVGLFLQIIYKKERGSDSSRSDKKIEVDFNSAMLGIIILTLLSFVPWIGEIVRVLSVLLSFGVMMLYYSEIIMKRKAIR